MSSQCTALTAAGSTVSFTATQSSADSDHQQQVEAWGMLQACTATACAGKLWVTLLVCKQQCLKPLSTGAASHMRLLCTMHRVSCSHTQRAGRHSAMYSICAWHVLLCAVLLSDPHCLCDAPAAADGNKHIGLKFDRVK